jgi:AcrR family transcriptional regulator
MITKQREKSLQPRQEIMEQAVTVFCRKGFKQATIAEITSQAGYAKGNFYRHWRSKDEIFLDIMEDRLRSYRATRQRKLERAESSEQAVHVIMDFLDTIVEDTAWARVILEFTTHAFGSDELKQKLNQSSYRLNTSLFADLLAPYVPDRESTRKLGALVTALFEGFLIQQFLETGVLGKEDLREAVLVLARNMLR